MSKKIEIYTKTTCPFCYRAKALLQQKGVAFQEIPVDDPAAQEAMTQRTGGYRTVPQVFVDDVFLQGGCDGLYERDERGELDQLLGLP